MSTLSSTASKVDPHQTAAIELRDISFSYDGERTILNRLYLHILPGEFFSLIGPSGCGKTTILSLVSGLMTPDSGQILIGDKDVTTMPTHKRDIGVVFQNYALFPHMTVFENVGYGLKMRGVSAAERKDIVEDALEMVGMGAMMKRFPGELSGGQQQRIGLARAVASRPRVMLLDEPLSNLDAKLREQMCIEISDLQRRLGMTMLYVTHDQGEAMAMSSRLAIMNGGVVEELGAPHSVYEKPKSHFGAQFLGNVNLFKASANKKGYRLTEDITLAAASLVDADTEVTVMVRPEAILLDAPADSANRFEATVTRCVYRGGYDELTLAIPGIQQEILATAYGKRGYAADDKLFCAIPPESIHILEANEKS